MTDTPTAYPPPQIVITYSGGRYHVDVAGEDDRRCLSPAQVVLFVEEWMLENEE